MGDDIIVDIGGGATARFPKGMTPKRIEFELKRAGIGAPPRPLSAAKFVTGNPFRRWRRSASCCRTRRQQRCHMTDPNDLKTVAPKVAARIREHVNRDYRLSRVIQFNSLLPPAITFGMLLPQMEEKH